MTTIAKLILIIAVFSDSLCVKKATGFVKILLQNPPVIDKADIWSRSLPQTAIYGNLSLALWRSMKVPTPSYVQILSEGILSVTSFSLLRKGTIMEFNLDDTTKSHIFRGDYLWPNELTTFKDRYGQSVLLIPDGFLLPGQNDGGLYAIRKHSSPNARPIRITAQKKGWFYHRATYVRLPGGQEGIITARANKPLWGPGRGELVWLSIPSSFHKNRSNKSYQMDPDKHEPWPETVLAEGPDVMFEVVDLDVKDNYLEVISAHFFGQKLSVHSLEAIKEHPFVRVVSTATLDTLGKPYGLCLATMTPPVDKLTEIPKEETVPFTLSSHRVRIPGKGRIDSKIKPKPHLAPERVLDSCHCDNSAPTHLLVTTHECKYDVQGLFEMAVSALAGRYPRVLTGGSSRLREGEYLPVELEKGQRRGGSLFAYELPRPTGSTGPTGPIGTSLRRAETPGDAAVTDAAGTRYVSSGSGTSASSSPTNFDTSTSLRTHPNQPRGQSPQNSRAEQHRRERATIPNETKDFQARSQTTSSTVSTPLPAHNTTQLNWVRHTLFQGFKVRGWGGIFAPGAPGFPYVFRMPNKPQSPPLILLAGDCTGSAYIFAPCGPNGPTGVKPRASRAAAFEEEPPGGQTFFTASSSNIGTETTDINADVSCDGGGASMNSMDQGRTSSPIFGASRTQVSSTRMGQSSLPTYELAFEVECGATVGSAAVNAASDGSGDVNIYIPSYELDQVQ